MTADHDGDDSDDAEQQPYVRMVKPRELGGKAFHRCRECGAELLVAFGGFDKIKHRDGCRHADNSRTGGE